MSKMQWLWELRRRCLALRPTSQSFLRLHSSLSGVKTDDCSPSFVHPAAIVHPSANLGEGVSIGPFCTVGPSVRLGNSCKLYPGSHVFGNSELGDNCTLMTNTKGTFETLRMIAKEQGYKPLFSGLSLNYLKVVPSVAIGFAVYDTMKAALHVPSRDDAVIDVITKHTESESSTSLHT